MSLDSLLFGKISLRVPDIFIFSRQSKRVFDGPADGEPEAKKPPNYFYNAFYSRSTCTMLVVKRFHAYFIVNFQNSKFYFFENFQKSRFFMNFEFATEGGLGKEEEKEEGSH